MININVHQIILLQIFKMPRQGENVLFERILGCLDQIQNESANEGDYFT